MGRMGPIAVGGQRRKGSGGGGAGMAMWCRAGQGIPEQMPPGVLLSAVGGGREHILTVADRRDRRI